MLVVNDNELEKPHATVDVQIDNEILNYFALQHVVLSEEICCWRFKLAV